MNTLPRKLLREVKYFRVPLPLQGNIFFFGRIGCLDEHTLILVVENGRLVARSLRNLSSQFNVLAHDFRSNASTVAQASKVCSGHKEVFKISFREGAHVVATKDHRFFRPDGTIVRLEDLVAGDVLLAAHEPLTIRRIRRLGKRTMTYDLIVPEFDSFYLANGLLSHNSGKTCKLLAFVQAYHSKGYKVWDFFGGKRGEGPYWALENDDPSLWDKLEAESYPLSEKGPKQYKVNLIYPMFSTLLPKELPHNPPHVKSRVFAIPIQEIEERDISLVIGPMGPKAQTLWQHLQHRLKKSSTGAQVDFLMDVKFPKMKSQAIYNLFIQPAIQNHLFCSSTSDLSMDWIAEASEKDTVTVLCLDYVPERFKFFVMGWLMKTLLRLAMDDRIHKKNIAMFREASAFMKVVDSDKSKEEITQIFRNQVSEVARYARSGLFLAMDTQDAAEVRGLVEGQDDLLGICEMPSPSSREVTCTPLRKDRRMNDAQIRAIATLPIESICIVARGQRAVILQRVQPPRCRYFKSTSPFGNFYSLWRHEVNLWTKSEHWIHLAEEEYRQEAELVLAERVKHQQHDEQVTPVRRKPKRILPDEQPQNLAPPASQQPEKAPHILDVEEDLFNDI